MGEKKQFVLLQVINSGQTQTYEIHKTEFMLGRSDASEVPISDNAISRVHLKIIVANNLVRIQDLKSANGTLIDGERIESYVFTTVMENQSVSFGKAQVMLKFKIVEVSEEIIQQGAEIEKKSNEDPVAVDISAFPKAKDNFKDNFKNIGLMVAHLKTPQQKAKEIIDGAEFIKRSIIKSAEVYKNKIINETNVQAKKASDEAYHLCQQSIDQLLDETRQQLQQLKAETEISLDNKRLQAHEEIQDLWKEHREILSQEKVKQLEIIEKENKVKLELSMEKLKGDMFIERRRLITDAESEILRKNELFQAEFENEKATHVHKIKVFTAELVAIEAHIVDCKKQYELQKQKHDEATLELNQVTSQLKQEALNLEQMTKSFNEIQNSHRDIQIQLTNFSETKKACELEKKQAETEIQKLSQHVAELTERKQIIDTEIKQMAEELADSKQKMKSDLQAEYHNLKQVESKKFNDFQAAELKSLQNVRDEHATSMKNFSVDLSQEIATKIEMLAKTSGFSQFNFEKHFELINSIIQIKSSATSGSESIHAAQLDGWKYRKRKESLNLLGSGFAIGLAFVFLGHAAYKKLNTDPTLERMAIQATEQKQRDLENQFVPVKVNKHFDSYVDSTIYTDKFIEVYLDGNIQQEWVNFATKYFLKQWHVDEEKVIQVISNSKAFVESISAAKSTLKKSRLSADVAKLKALEDENKQSQAKILGTNVKYEAYKKIEKDFFWPRIQQRSPAAIK